MSEDKRPFKQLQDSWAVLAADIHQWFLSRNTLPFFFFPPRPDTARTVVVHKEKREKDKRYTVGFFFLHVTKEIPRNWNGCIENHWN